MTYIHPDHHKNILNVILAGLVFGSLVGIFSLVALYNTIVDLNHSIAAAKTELGAIGTKNAALNNQVMGAFHGIASSNLAAQNGLIEDSHPRYFPLNQSNPSWPIASQR